MAWRRIGDRPLSEDYKITPYCFISKNDNDMLPRNSGTSYVSWFMGPREY